MPDPLDSAHLKLKRAVEHLNALDDEVRAFADSEVERVRAERDPESAVPVYAIWSPEPDDAVLGEIAQVQRELRARFSVILGDFLGNLRSALDHAVNGVATPPGDYTKFPIVAKKNKWRDVATSDLAGVPCPYRTAIRAMQPYHGHRRGKRLLMLATLCNADKHKVIYPTGLAVYMGFWTDPKGSKIQSIKFLETGVLGDEAKISVTIVSPDGPPEVQGGAPYRIAFADPRTKETIANHVDLTVMLDEVRGIIAEIEAISAA